jgi:hypothetical protein
MTMDEQQLRAIQTHFSPSPMTWSARGTLMQMPSSAVNGLSAPINVEYFDEFLGGAYCVSPYINPVWTKNDCDIVCIVAANITSLISKHFWSLAVRNRKPEDTSVNRSIFAAHVAYRIAQLTNQIGHITLIVWNVVFEVDSRSYVVGRLKEVVKPDEQLGNSWLKERRLLALWLENIALEEPNAVLYKMVNVKLIVLRESAALLMLNSAHQTSKPPIQKQCIRQRLADSLPVIMPQAILMDWNIKQMRDKATLQADAVALLRESGPLPKKKIITALRTVKWLVDEVMEKAEAEGKIERFRILSQRRRMDEYWCIAGTAPVNAAAMSFNAAAVLAAMQAHALQLATGVHA